MITIVLADDHLLVRQGLRLLLETDPDFRILAEASHGLEALEIIKTLQPDVLLLDMVMPGLNGTEVAHLVSQRHPLTRVLMLSMHNDEAYVLQALKNGAAGYILKEASGAELILAIREVAAGRHYLSPSFNERAIETYIQKANGDSLDPYDEVSDREREVLHLAAQGLSNTEIATHLFLSTRTVEGHRSNLMHKLGLKNQTDLVRYAIRHGIVPLT